MTLLTYRPGDAIPDFDASVIISHKADEHLCTDGGRCSLWWNTVPEMPGEMLGIIGHFQASSQEAAEFLLEASKKRLASLGCTLAVGPMDGNTWRRYRVLTERGEEPAFFMEPDNPEWWAPAFASSGFTPLATYSSSLVKDLRRKDPRAERAKMRLEKDGIRFRNVNLSCFEEDLCGIYEVSLVSFPNNFLYTPISEQAFMDQYLPYRDKIVSDLVFLAEDAGRPVGYLFAVPDYAEAMRGQVMQTVIGKTLAILPGRRYGGLGVVLTGMLHQRAADLGYSRLIHALQNEENQVQNLSGFYGEKMRRYVLFSCQLTGGTGVPPV
jgi:GNAT superfamily N-acetyltransferase